MTVDNNKITINKEDIFEIKNFVGNHSVLIIGMELSITIFGICTYIENKKGVN